ncbi:hypothetical protein JDV02_007999 [Purpureocillium takamizusanense]|uniref:Uncharacterized protein n=1 Tax=Purpureocillium takamizusanense TaxID=2060973 RepID=A0A9Q8QMV7_9HYPO|nr:uncharacterized protein JDV02_007999 [Purpureocillium takamizusanense]UNI22076.1 hypothetical protein JDV02_007999 [Purpureocillium takamizusanense]
MTGKRKRVGPVGADEFESSGLKHNDRASGAINPFSRTPSERHQLHVAGLSDTEEDPTHGIKHFPHRGFGRRVSIKGVDGSGGELFDNDDDDEHGQRASQAPEAIQGARRSTPADPRGSHLDVLLRAIHQFLDRGQVALAAKAYALVLQLRPGSRPIDVRQHGLWALGAEILMREGEDVTPRPPVAGGGGAAAAAAHGSGPPVPALVKQEAGDGDGFSARQPTASAAGQSSMFPTSHGSDRVPRRWGSPSNMPKVKAYFETLIQQHPYDYKFPRSVSALDFQLAMLGCEIYNVYAEHRWALARAEAEVEVPEDEDQQSLAGVSNNEDHGRGYGREEASDPQSRLDVRKDEIRLRAVAGMDDITRRMDTLMQQLPYRKSHHFLRMRATASLYLADLVVPAGQVAGEHVHHAELRRQRELETAVNVLDRLLENGGELDDVARAVLEGQHVKAEEYLSPPPLYPSLPIRGV